MLYASLSLYLLYKKYTQLSLRGNCSAQTFLCRYLQIKYTDSQSLYQGKPTYFNQHNEVLEFSSLLSLKKKIESTIDQKNTRSEPWSLSVHLPKRTQSQTLNLLVWNFFYVKKLQYIDSGQGEHAPNVRRASLPMASPRNSSLVITVET